MSREQSREDREIINAQDSQIIGEILICIRKLYSFDCQSRARSLCKTKLEEAIHWLQQEQIELDL